MQQQTIITCPVQLFRVRPETSELVDKGRCVCALVGLPAQPPKYSLVCYNSKQELLCVARLAASNDTSLQFRVDSARSGYASFRDDLLDTWTVLFAQHEQLVRLLAELGVALYVLNGRRTERALCALRSFADVSEEGLTVGVHEALAQYTAFAIPGSAAAGSSNAWLPTTERVVETTVPPSDLFGSSLTTLSQSSSAGASKANADEDSEAGSDGTERQQRDGPYRFFPVASMHGLPPYYRGFESSLNGVSEGGYGVVVVPAASRAPPASQAATPVTPLTATDVVFVVRLVQVRHRDVRADAETARRGDARAGHALPPAVFAEADRSHPHNTSGSGLALDAGTPSTHAVVPYTGSSASLSGATDGIVALAPQPTWLTASATTPAGAVGGPGVPLAHMTLIQKIAAGVQTAIVTTRDLRDTASQAEETWSYTVNRPKPSALSNASLLEQVQALVRTAEARASEMARYDDVVRTMETQNTETQRRIEELSRRCDTALKTRANVEAAAVDANLDRRRLLLRLKEELSRATEEREDTRRRLDGARKLLQTSTEVLRVERGKLDIQRVQQLSLETRLAAAVEAGAAERERRTSLEAKIAETQSEVRRAQAELRLIADRLHALDGKADSERDRYGALMEDERHRISGDALELRQNAVAELRRQEEQQRAAYARLQQEHYERGYLEGKSSGRDESTTDLSVHRKELAVEVQRSSESLASCKEELQRGLEASLALRRTNESNLQEVKRSLSEALERRAQLEMLHARLTTQQQHRSQTDGGSGSRVGGGGGSNQTQEEIVGRVKGMLASVAVPVPPSLLYQVIEIAQRGDSALPVSLVNQLRELEEAYVRDALIHRAGWVEEELFSIYEKGEAVYYQQWQHALQPAHAALRVTMQSLFRQAHGSLGVALYEVWLMETDARQQIEASRDTFMRALAKHQSEQATQRARLERDATTALHATFRAFERGLRSIRLLWESQLRARAQLALEETEARVTLEHEAEVAGRALPQAFADLRLGRELAAQRLVLEAEEAARATLLTDECTNRSGVQFRFATEADVVAQLAQCRARGRACAMDESQERVRLLAEEDTARRTLQAAWREIQGLPSLADTPVPPPPPPPAATAANAVAPVKPVAVAVPPPPQPAMATATPPTGTTPVIPLSPPPPQQASAPVVQAVPPTPAAAAVTAPAPPPPHPVPAPAAPSNSTTRSVIRDDEDAFDHYWLTPPPPTGGPPVPPPLPPDDDTDIKEEEEETETAREQATGVKPTSTTPSTTAAPATPPKTAEAVATTPARPTQGPASSKASPIAGLAMAEHQWRPQRNVLDDFDPRAHSAEPQETEAPPPPPPPAAPVKKVETHAAPTAAPVPTAAPQPRTQQAAQPARDIPASSNDDDDDSESGSSSTETATPERVRAPLKTASQTAPAPPNASAKAPPPSQPAPAPASALPTKSSPAPAPPKSAVAAARGPSKEASKAATAAEAAAARAEKMRLFESSDDEM